MYRCKEVVLAVLGRASTSAFRELAQLRVVSLSRQKEVHAIFKPLSIERIQWHANMDSRDGGTSRCDLELDECVSRWR